MYFLLLLVLALVSCGAPQEPAPTIRVQAGASLCADACAHLRSLGCAEGEPIRAPADVSVRVACGMNDNTASCVTCDWFCDYQHQNGVYWNTPCLVDVATCGAVESCNVQ
jgi:hypothetical protein